jgi:hypothetical protein
VRGTEPVEPLDRGALPTLRRDPNTRIPAELVRHSGVGATDSRKTIRTGK